MIRCWQYLLNLPIAVRWVLLLLVFITWTTLCWWPVYEDDGVSLINDKLAHMIGNFGLFGVLLIARQQVSLVLAAAFVCVYSLGIELVQIPISGRFFDVYDLLANTTGVLLAVLVVNRLNKHIGVPRGLVRKCR